jgi:hypothetical protein
MYKQAGDRRTTETSAKSSAFSVWWRKRFEGTYFTATMMMMMTFYEIPAGLQAVCLIVLFLVSITSYAKRLTLFTYADRMEYSIGLSILNGDNFWKQWQGRKISSTSSGRVIDVTLQDSRGTRLHGVTVQFVCS